MTRPRARARAAAARAASRRDVAPSPAADPGHERRATAAAIVAGAALGASFVDFRLFVLPWLALPLLLMAIADAPPRRAFLRGWIAGVTGLALAFSWLVYAIRVFGGFAAPLAVVFALVPVAWMALELGIAAGLLAWLGPLPFGLAPPLVFTAVEFLFPSFVPWRLAHSQYRVPTLLQSGDLAGPALLGFAMVWTAAGLRDALTPPWTLVRAARAVAPPLALVAALVVYGDLRLAAVAAARERAPVLRVGVVQGNVDIARKGDRAFFARNLEDYRALSRALPADTELVIWPETVVQHRLDVARPRLAFPEDPFPDAAAPLLFGGLAVARTPGRERLYNSAFLREHGTVTARYDKHILVPFGEYMPFGDAFPSLSALSPATSHFTAGTGTDLLPVGAHARVAALVCYEDVVPGLARAAAAAGATLLVNLTNDAWYGDGPEPRQHQALAIWRALETRRDLVRATNTGLTSVVAATGDVVAELPTFAPASLAVDVRLLEGRTPYVVIGDAFAWVVVAALAAVLLIRLRSGARDAPPRAAAVNCR